MSNRFALLSDDTSDNESPAPVAAKAAPAPAAAAPAKPAAANARTQTRTKGDYPARGGPRKVFNERGLPGSDANESDALKDARAERTAGQRGGRGSGGRGPRGGRGGRGSGGNRPMDRHSQTDRVDSHKQEHQAWGGDEGKRELNDENNGEADAKAAVSGVATPVNGEASTPINGTIPEETAPVAEEDNTKTYDEWLAEQTKPLNIGLPKPEARKANEGSDDSQWKDAVAISRKEEDETFFAGVAKDSGKARKRPQKEGKTYIEVEQRYERPASSRGRGGDRGARGAGRGGGRGRGEARGASRGGRSQANAAPSVDDAQAFPSLS